MPKRTGTVIIVALTAIACMSLFKWIHDNQAPVRRARALQAMGLRPADVTPRQRQILLGNAGTSPSGAPVNILRESRLIASLAQQAGPFTVSVRNIRTTS